MDDFNNSRVYKYINYDRGSYPVKKINLLYDSIVISYNILLLYGRTWITQTSLT